MKKSTLLLYALSICFFAFNSCGKKNDNGVYVPGNHSTTDTTTVPGGNPGSNSGGSITATIGGTSFSSASVTEGFNLSYLFVGTNSASVGFSITLDSLYVGTHKLLPFFNTLMYYPSGKSYTAPNPTTGVSPGSIIVTSNSGTAISGTFSCTMYNPNNLADSVMVTNGVFTNLSY